MAEGLRKSLFFRVFVGRRRKFVSAEISISQVGDGKKIWKGKYNGEQCDMFGSDYRCLLKRGRYVPAVKKVEIVHCGRVPQQSKNWLEKSSFIRAILGDYFPPRNWPESDPNAIPSPSFQQVPTRAFFLLFFFVSGPIFASIVRLKWSGYCGNIVCP